MVHHKATRCGEAPPLVIGVLEEDYDLLGESADLEAGDGRAAALHQQPRVGLKLTAASVPEPIEESHGRADTDSQPYR